MEKTILLKYIELRNDYDLKKQDGVERLITNEEQQIINKVNSYTLEDPEFRNLIIAIGNARVEERENLVNNYYKKEEQKNIVSNEALINSNQILEDNNQISYNLNPEIQEQNLSLDEKPKVKVKTKRPMKKAGYADALLLSLISGFAFGVFVTIIVVLNK